MATLPLPKASKGERPFELEDHDNERLLCMVLALTGEVSVLYDQLDSLTRLIVERGHLHREDIDHYQPDAAAEAERAERRKNLIDRVMRIVIADSERARRDEQPYEELLAMVQAKPAAPAP